MGNIVDSTLDSRSHYLQHFARQIHHLLCKGDLRTENGESCGAGVFGKKPGSRTVVGAGLAVKGVGLVTVLEN